MNKKDINNRANFMTEDQKRAMGNLPRSHYNCKDRKGVFRPGKTKQDKARKGLIK